MFLEAASGPPMMLPAIEDQLPQLPPKKSICQQVLSATRAKTPTNPLPRETAPGSDAIEPPSEAQLDQPLVPHHLCQSALSGPRANTSTLLPSLELTSGLPTKL